MINSRKQKYISMESIAEMRRDIVDQKAKIEEEMGKENETKTIIHQLAQDLLRKLHRYDKNAVIDLKAEAFDELRRLQKEEEQIKSLVKMLASLEKPSPQILAEVADLVPKIEELGYEKDFTLSVGIKEADMGNPCDSVFLKTKSIDPANITMSIESSERYIRILLEPTHGLLYRHSFKKVQFSAKGLKTGKIYQKLSGSNDSMFSLHKTEEDLSISVTIFGCNIKNSPLKWIHDDEVTILECIGVEKSPVFKRACPFERAFWEDRPFFARFLRYCLFFFCDFVYILR